MAVSTVVDVMSDSLALPTLAGRRTDDRATTGYYTGAYNDFFGKRPLKTQKEHTHRLAYTLTHTRGRHTRRQWSSDPWTVLCLWPRFRLPGPLFRVPHGVESVSRAFIGSTASMKSFSANERGATDVVPLPCAVVSTSARYFGDFIDR